jgi:carboxypeptidase PM20D1
MIQMLWWILLAIAAFLLVLIVRALRFSPAPQPQKEPVEAPIDARRVQDDLAQMIRCRTVSYYDKEKIDESEFERFRTLLQTLYPRLSAACTRHRIETGVLYHLKGKSADSPSVFMAHYDVVPVNESLWERPAFDAIVEDGVMWGRGTLDTKGTLCATLEAIEALLGEGFVPQQDMYFAFAADEEVAGITAPAMVDWFESHGIHPGFVIDEGGAVVDHVFPGVTQPCALIGIAEKGMLNAELRLNGAGGHASAPPTHTAIGRLAKAVCDIERHPFRRQLSAPIAQMFDTLGRHSNFTYRLIFANLWCFLPLLDLLCKKQGGELNAMLRTTCAFTQASGSAATNVLPPEASVGANLRLCGRDTDDYAVSYLRSLIHDPDIEVVNIHSMNPSVISRTQGQSWQRLCDAVNQTWPEAIVSPYLMLACSDSRHYGRICDQVYRFSAMALTSQERGYIHGNNERVPVEKVVRACQFYYRLMRQF